VLTRNEKLGLAGIFLAFAAYAISINILPPLVTTVAEAFHSRYEDFGYVFMLNCLFFALASFTGGWAASRFGIGSRSLVMAGLVGMGLLLMSISLLPGTGWLALWMLPLGYAGGFSQTFSVILTLRFGRSDSSKILNFSQFVFCLGAVATPPLVATMLRYDAPWQLAFISFGAVILLISVAFMILTRGITDISPRDVPPSDSARVGHERGASSSPKPFLSDPIFCFLCASVFADVVVESSVFSWVAAYFQNQLNVPVASAAWRVSIFWAGLGTGRVLILLLPSRLTLWPGMIGSALAVTVACVLLSLTWSVPVVTGFLFLVGVAAGPFWPILISVSQHLRQSVQFTSAVISVGAVGAAFGPLLSAYAIKHLGLWALFPVLALMEIIALSTGVAAWVLAARQKQPN
jgi:fucose permease